MANKPAAPVVPAAEMNYRQRNAVLANAIRQELPIYTQSFTTSLAGGLGQVINVPLRNIGLVTGFTILVTATLAGSGGSEANTLQPFGPANFFSNVNLTDLSNQTRINTTGAHLHYVKTARDRNAAFGAFQNDSSTNIGTTYNPVVAPGTIGGAAVNQTLRMAYEVPVSYSPTDLRGAIYANVVNATWNLGLTVNPNMFATSTGNGVSAIYKSNSAAVGRLITWTVEIYQHFYENLPLDQNRQVIVPMLDTATMYRLESTTTAGLVANQEMSAPFANMRSFLSTFAVYDNNGALNPGTDINYFGIQTANTTNLFKRSTAMIFAKTRERIGDDFPAGVYYFDHRESPIETSAYGNVALTWNASTVAGAQSQMLLWYEYFANMALVQQAGSIQN